MIHFRKSFKMMQRKIDWSSSVQ